MKKTMNIIKKAAAGLFVLATLSVGVMFTAPAASALSCDMSDPANLTLANGANCSKSDDQKSNLFGDDGIFKQITDTALFLIGAVSVIMLIYGGVRYTISGGDSAAVTNAKNTILYAIVGIIVAVLAYAVVNFVIGSLA